MENPEHLYIYTFAVLLLTVDLVIFVALLNRIHYYFTTYVAKSKPVHMSDKTYDKMKGCAGDVVGYLTISLICNSITLVILWARYAYIQQ